MSEARRGRVGTVTAPLRLDCRFGRVPAVVMDDTPDRPDTGETGWSDDEEATGAAAMAALQAARERLGGVPAAVVVVNHVMGLYELAAIHLSAEPPQLSEAVLAIDAMACLVEGLGERLGEETAMLGDALANIRLAFVQVKASA